MKKYTKQTYERGTRELNLFYNERVLIIKALLKANWNIAEAMRLNYPKENVTRETYSKMLFRHHISVRNKTFLPFSKIP